MSTSLSLQPPTVPHNPKYDEMFKDLTGFEGSPFPIDFPEGTTFLEKANWYNYFDKPLPKLFPSPEENRRMWQELEIEKMLDWHPVHDIYAGDLPEYHFQPAIQNERENKLKPGKTSDLDVIYHADQTLVPRFFKTGMPKIPVQKQVWYVPLDDEGRFDQKKNLELNGYYAATSVKGWGKQRFHRTVHFGAMKTWANLRLANETGKIWMREAEQSSYQRWLRIMRGNYTTRLWLTYIFYCGVLGYYSGAGAHHRMHVYEHDIYNPDIWFIRYYNETGAFHSPLA